MVTVQDRKESWLDRRAYPFTPNYLDVDGGRMHYIDEGSGNPIIFVHGQPTWSFMFRGVTRFLMRDHRCVAPDNIGFGLSSKPETWSYTPYAHSKNLGRLVEHLDLRNITLVLHDFGGPVGASFALEHLDRVDKLVFSNSFLWDLSPDEETASLSKLANSPVGKMAYLNMNAAPKKIRSMFVDRDKYTDAVHKAYFGPFENKQDRNGAFCTAKLLSDCSGWFSELWSERSKFKDKKLLLLWGEKDPVLGVKALNKLWHEFPLAETKCFEDAGHMLFEEKPAAIADALTQFVKAASSAFLA